MRTTAVPCSWAHRDDATTSQTAVSLETVARFGATVFARFGVETGWFPDVEKSNSTSDKYYFVQASRPNVTPPSFPPETFLTRMMEEEVPAPPGVRPDIRRKAVMVQVVRLIFNTPQPSALLTGSLHDDDPLVELVREYEAVRRGSHRIRPL